MDLMDLMQVPAIGWDDKNPDWRRATPAGKPFTMGWAEVAALRIDPRYQREIGKTSIGLIRRIATRFDWALFDVLTVMPAGEMTADGKVVCVIIDGQHRAAAALLAGIAKVPVRIVHGGPQEAARIFAAINHQRLAVTGFDLYRAALAAGEAWAIRMRDTAKACDCTMMTANRPASDRKPREIYSIGLMREWCEHSEGGVTDGPLFPILRGLANSREGRDDAAAWTDGNLKVWFGTCRAALGTRLGGPVKAPHLALALDAAGGLASLREKARAMVGDRRARHLPSVGVTAQMVLLVSDVLDTAFGSER